MSNSNIKILFLAANPTDETRLRLGAEATKIKEALEHATFRNFVLSQDHAVRLDSIQRLILKERPHIVHFSGHGSHMGALVFENNSGHAVEADPEAIANIFKYVPGNVRLIVLNACYSNSQAKALAKHVDAVIGMTTGVLDETATAFAKALYKSLGERCNLRSAFDLATNYIKLQGLSGAEIPVLIEREGVLAAAVQLLPASPQ